MAFVRRSVRQAVGSSGGGIYRRPIYHTRTSLVPLSSSARRVIASAGEIEIVGYIIGPIVAARAGEILIESDSGGILTNGQAVLAAGAGVIDIVGGRPVVFHPGTLRMILSNALRRRVAAARYSTRHPLPDYDVQIPVVMQPLPYRIIQADTGVIDIVGGVATLAVDGFLRLNAAAAEVLIEGGAGTVSASTQIAAGAGEIEIVGYQAKAAEIENNAIPNAGLIEVVGYTATVIATGAWNPQDSQSASWSLASTSTNSWSDLVIVTNVWRRE